MIRSFHVLAASCVAFAFVLAVAGCSKEAKPAGGGQLPASNLPDSYWLKAEPAGAKPAAEVREHAKTGDQVVVTGIVGGVATPFTEGVAAFTIVDKSAKPCTPDECPTPWDFCCEDKTKLTKAMVTIEFREKGAAIKTSARGFHGLDHMKHVVVAGEAKRDEAGNVVVVATGIFVQP